MPTRRRGDEVLIEERRLGLDSKTDKRGGLPLRERPAEGSRRRLDAGASNASGMQPRRKPLSQGVILSEA
jgi:hypothetical protein